VQDVFPDLPGLSKLCGLFCHQLPWRSPQFEGTVFPVCFRCAGLYVGFLSAYLHLALTGGWRRRLPELRCALATSSLTLPFLFDVWAKTLRLWTSEGWMRAVTGLGVGVALPLLLVPLAQRESTESTGRLKPTVSGPAQLLGPIVIGSTMLWLVIHPGRLLLFQLLALMATLGSLLFLISFCAALFQIGRGSFLARVNSALRPHLMLVKTNAFSRRIRSKRFRTTR
jgi:uncharacterized membrane protein